MLKLNPKSGYVQLDEAIAALQTKRIIVPVGRGYKSTTWISGVDTSIKGEIGLEVSDTLKELLLDLKYDFTKVQ